jgi:hypothetical protein
MLAKVLDDEDEVESVRASEGTKGKYILEGNKF